MGWGPLSSGVVPTLQQGAYSLGGRDFQGNLQKEKKVRGKGSAKSEENPSPVQQHTPGWLERVYEENWECPNSSAAGLQLLRPSLLKMASWGQAGESAGGPLSSPFPPSLVREQRMGMSENALLPSLVWLQASARKRRGEVIAWAIFQSKGLSSSAPSQRFFRPRGPGAWVDGGKPEASSLPEKDPFLVDGNMPDLKTLSTPGQLQAKVRPGGLRVKCSDP